jgi:GT2 family glycosyltransferase
VDLSIIIVNWNSKEHLRKCIASILTYTRMPRYEIVVIDSGSFDGCDQMLRENYPDVRFIQSAANLGFAKANNRAFEATLGECVLFLNPDTECVGPAIDTLCARAMSLPDAGVVGARLLNSDGTAQSSCIQSTPTVVNQLLNSAFLRKLWPRSRLWGNAALYDSTAVAREVEAVSGACLMVRRKTFEEVGRFCEDYFMYMEDVDLSYRTRRAGYRNYYVHDAIVTHFGGISSELAVSAFAAVMMPEAIWRFLRKTRGRAYASAYRLAMLMSAIGRLCVLTLASISGHRTVAAEASRQKWQAVLLWSLERDHIVSHYYGATK